MFRIVAQHSYDALLCLSPNGDVFLAPLRGDVISFTALVVPVALHSAAQCYTTLDNVPLCCATLHCAAMCSSTLRCSAFRNVYSRDVVFHFATLRLLPRVPLRSTACRCD